MWSRAQKHLSVQFPSLMPVIYRQALKGGISVDSAFRVSNVKALGMKDGWNCFLRTKFQQSWHQHYGIILKIDLKKKNLLFTCQSPLLTCNYGQQLCSLALNVSAYTNFRPAYKIFTGLPAFIAELMMFHLVLAVASQPGEIEWWC